VKDCVQEEGEGCLSPSSTLCCECYSSESCMDVVVSVFLVTSTFMNGCGAPWWAVAELKLLLTCVVLCYNNFWNDGSCWTEEWFLFHVLLISA